MTDKSSNCYITTLRWYLLVHQLPPKPLYLRAKIGARLARVGGVALKNSVYVLPERDDCLEDFQWIAEEAVAGGGAAYVCRTEFLDRTTDLALKERFLSQVTEAYEALKGAVAGALDEVRKRARESAQPPAGVLLRMKKRLDEIAGIDFFDAPARKEAETMVRALEVKLQQGAGSQAAKSRVRRSELVGRTWVTRRDSKVDRLASAWLIRRFIDPGARFRFIDPGGAVRPGEIGFDLVGGEFTHEGDHCTFETLIERTGLSEPGLSEIAEIVHDLDVKDGKYGRPDAQGIQQLIQGVIRSHPRDEDRVARGLELFDDLHASFREGSAPRRGRGKRKAAQRHR